MNETIRHHTVQARIIKLYLKSYLYDLNNIPKPLFTHFMISFFFSLCYIDKHICRKFDITFGQDKDNSSIQQLKVEVFSFEI